MVQMKEKFVFGCTELLRIEEGLIFHTCFYVLVLASNHPY